MELYESIDVWQLHFMWLEEQQASEHEDVKCSKVTMKTPLMYLHPLSSVLTNIPFPSTLGDMEWLHFASSNLGIAIFYFG